MGSHDQRVLYSVDLRGCIVLSLSALAPEASTAAFGDALTNAGATVVQAVSTSVQEISRADGHRPSPDGRP